MGISSVAAQLAALKKGSAPKVSDNSTVNHIGVIITLMQLSSS
jgi:hypothetical protein